MAIYTANATREGETVIPITTRGPPLHPLSANAMNDGAPTRPQGDRGPTHFSYAGPPPSSLPTTVQKKLIPFAAECAAYVRVRE